MTIGAILIAWRLLNAAFLKSPIGLITTLILAIGLLYDDYQTWKEGGKSLIDWSRWQPEIEQAKKVLKWLRDRFLELKDNTGGWKNTLTLLFSFWLVQSWFLCWPGSGGLSPGLPVSVRRLAALLVAGKTRAGYCRTGDKKPVVADVHPHQQYADHQRRNGVDWRYR